jgi:hypothetical protein
MSDDIKYEYKSVQAVRGLENRSIAKAQQEGGWELYDQTQGTLRTTLKFRRVKPETFLSKAWVAFRGLEPARQRVVAAGLAILLLLAAVGIGTATALDKGSTNAENSATKPTEAVAVNEKPTPSPTPTASKTDQVTSRENSATASDEPAAVKEKPAPSSSEDTEQVINVKNNKDFAALLLATDYCAPSMAQFADKYQGRKIEFDGSIVNMQHHENYKTRYDILIGPGNAGPKTTAGPAFKYEDVNMFDLKFAGTSVPSYVAEGDNFRFTAEVGEYNANQGCLFFLTPVSTTVR